jgi:transposase
MILDGNQRVRACREARIEPRYIEFTGTDAEALDIVWDLNFARRQLNASQKATAIAKATLLYERGRPEKMSAGGQLTDKLAEKAGVGRSTVYDAKKVLRHGTKEEVKALESGESKAKPLAEAIRSREKQCDNGEVVDDNGTPVPVAAREYWNRKPEAKNVLAQIKAARGQVKKLLPDDPMWCEVNLNGVLADLASAINRFSSAVPAYICPYCKGITPDSCKGCKGRGVISKFMWSMVPEEMRKLHEIKGTLNGRISS